MRTLQQRRAEHALRAIKERGKADPNVQSSYRSYVNALPATILNNGLGQAAATLLAAAKGKTGDAHHLLYEDLSAWLCGNRELRGLPLEGDLIEALMEHDQHVYVRAQGEALSYLQWLKQFARAYLRSSEEDAQNDAGRTDGRVGETA